MRALQAFQDMGINVQHIESRPSQTGDNQADFMVDIDCDSRKLEQLSRLLKREVLTMVIGSYGDGQLKDNEFPPPTPLSATASFGQFTPYYTHYLQLLNKINKNGNFITKTINSIKII